MGDSQRPQHPLYESCLCRVTTFSTWTQYNFFDIHALAQAGFYNIADGTTDVTHLRCFFCGIEICNMSPEDDFLFEHFKQSPDCGHLSHKLGTNAMNEYQERIHTGTQVHQQVQATSRNAEHWTELDHIRSPQYEAYSNRLSSFARWPPDIRQKPEELADAGFYYTGFQDIVRCFACDEGLQNWEPDDNPWIEHARWFPQCPFVKRIKGQEFIDLVRRLTEESDEEEDEESLSTSDLNYSVMATSDLNREEDADVLTTASARSVMEFGYNANIVATAINTLRNKGCAEYTAADILEVILDLEETEEILKCNDNASLLRNSRLQCPDQSSAEERKRQSMRCAHCGRVEILFIWCNNHCTCRNCAECKFICSRCSSAIRDSDS